MRALVTGGAGFIGSNLVDLLLANGHVVDVVDNLSTGTADNLVSAGGCGSRFQFAHLDVRSPRLSEFVLEREPEVIFHLAAQPSVAASVNDPLLDAEVNVLGSLRVLEAARAAHVRRVVFAASGGTLYGEADDGELPVNEAHPHCPLSPYGISKGAVVDYLRAYARLYGMSSMALVLANVYGPRQDPHGEAGVVAIFADNLLSGRPTTIDGDGAQTRDFVFVSDVAQAFARAGESEMSGLCNIGTGEETSVSVLYELLCEAVGAQPSPVHGPPRSGDLRRSALDASLAKAVLDWEPRVPLGEGLAAVVASMREG